MISAVLETALSCPGSIASCFVLCQEVSLGCPWSYRLCFLGSGCSSLQSSFSEPFWSVFDVDNLLEELARNCVAPQDTPVRRPTEFLHVEVGLVLRVGFGFNGHTNEKHTQILMGQVLQILLNLRCVRILA